MHRNDSSDALCSMQERNPKEQELSDPDWSGGWFESSNEKN